MKIIREFTLDVSRHGVQCTVPVVQHDAGVHRLVIHVRNGHEPVVFGEGDRAVLYLDKDQYDPVTVYTDNGAYPNSLVYDVTPRATETDGEYRSVLQIYTCADSICYTPEFLFSIKKDMTEGTAVLSSPQYAAVIQAQSAAEEYARQAQEAKNDTAAMLGEKISEVTEYIDQKNEVQDKQLADHKEQLEDHGKGVSENAKNIESNKKSIDELKESTSKDIAALKTGKADLKDGKVPAEQLPSYVDDVIDGKYVSDTKFTDSEGEALVAEFGKIYVDTDTGDFYRWSGSVYIKVSTANLAAIVQTLIERCAENTKNKLDKVTSNGSLRAYGVDNEGNQTMISTTASAEGNALLLTDENGNSSVADPTEDTHIANKKFVDKENVKQNNMFANALKGEASGELVLLTDVSPIEHNVRVKLKSKNLLWNNYNDLFSAMAVDNGHFDITMPSTYDGYLPAVDMEKVKRYCLRLDEGTYRISIYNLVYSHASSARNVIQFFGNLRTESNEVLSHESILIVGRETSCTFSVESGTTLYIIPYLYNMLGEEVTASFDVMLTEGPDIVDFVPSVPSDATVTLTTCGKNLVKYPYSRAPAQSVQQGLTYTLLEDGGINVKGTCTGMTTYTVGDWYYGNNGFIASYDLYFDGVTSHRTWYRHWASAGTIDKTYYPQIEIGSVRTEYEPYKQGETITTILAEGAVLKNIYPNMSIIPDIEGVVVDVEYIKDSNMVIEKLTQAIIALGGNI